MKTNSAITLFATAALLLLIITTYHDYNITVVQFTWSHVTYVSFYNRAEKKKKKRRKSYAYVFRNLNQMRLWHVCSHTATCVPAYAKAACIHACTRTVSKIPRRELHYILLDYINSVDKCACARVTFYTRTFDVWAERTLRGGCTIACVRHARNAYARTLTRREILWRCNWKDMYLTFNIDIIEYYRTRQYSVSIFRFWELNIELKSVILERMLLQIFIFRGIR